MTFEEGSSRSRGETVWSRAHPIRSTGLTTIAERDQPALRHAAAADAQPSTEAIARKSARPRLVHLFSRRRADRFGPSWRLPDHAEMDAGRDWLRAFDRRRHRPARADAGRAIVDAARSERLVAGLAVATIGCSALAYALWPIFRW